MIDPTTVAPPHGDECGCHVCASVLAHTFNARQMRRYAHGEDAGKALAVIGQRMRWARALRAEHNLTTGGEDE